MRNALVIAGALGCAVLVSRCGELPQTTFYEQGEYRGKPDGLPWDSAGYKGDRAAWEKALKTRNNAQNEYARISN